MITSIAVEFVQENYDKPLPFIRKIRSIRVYTDNGMIDEKELVINDNGIVRNYCELLTDNFAQDISYVFDSNGNYLHTFIPKHQPLSYNSE